MTGYIFMIDVICDILLEDMRYIAFIFKFDIILTFLQLCVHQHVKTVGLVRVLIDVRAHLDISVVDVRHVSKCREVTILNYNVVRTIYCPKYFSNWQNTFGRCNLEIISYY